MVARFFQAKGGAGPVTGLARRGDVRSWGDWEILILENSG